MRLGIYGGSFDPVHNAHLAVVRACQDQAALDQVWLVPTAVQPLKQHGPQASDAERVEMLRLATEDEPTWRVCTLEIDRGGVSYTVDTLRQIHQQLPDVELFILMGADTLRDVPNWREPDEIFRLATPLIVQRAGQPAIDAAALSSMCPPEKAPQLIEMPAMDISSSEVRRRVLTGEPIDALVPPAVAAYIVEHSLYS